VVRGGGRQAVQEWTNETQDVRVDGGIALAALAGLLSAYIPAVAHAETVDGLYELISSRIQKVDGPWPSGAPAPLIRDSSKAADQPLL